MTVKPRFDQASAITRLPQDRRFLDDVWLGLGAEKKTLPAKYFYDAAGSELFEAITDLPEYYPTRSELKIIDAHGPDIAQHLPAGAALVEFGSGSTVKVRRLLRHLDKLKTYVPVDVSGAFLQAQADVLRKDFPRIAIEPVIADFTRPFTLPGCVGSHPRAGFFPGSTIGNFHPNEAVSLLDAFGTVLGDGAMLIVGVDLVKQRDVLEAAYDDAAGVTAAFNMNLLARINRELAGDFVPERFRHRAFFNAEASRIEMHLVSAQKQQVRIGARSFGFDADESIHTESSYKYSIDGFRTLAAKAGWSAQDVWTDENGLFSVHALKRSANATP